MSDKVNGQCLMIKTKDHRKFFTHEKNYIQLIEFSKLFNAEVSVVKVREAEVLDLGDLAPALCNANYQQSQPVECQIVEVKIQQNKKTRKDILKNAKRIQQHIKAAFMRGEVVSLKELASRFRKLKVTNACLCTHLAQVRNELARQGHNIVKVGGGRYRMVK